jgi:hypothetical protein
VGENKMREKTETEKNWKNEINGMKKYKKLLVF